VWHAAVLAHGRLSDDSPESTDASQRDRGHLLRPDHHYSERRYSSLFVHGHKRQRHPAAGIDAHFGWGPFRDAHFVRQLYVHDSGDGSLWVYWHAALPHRCPLSPATLPKGTVGNVVHTDHENRIRALERFRFTLGGLAVIGGAVAGYVGYILGHAVH